MAKNFEQFHTVVPAKELDAELAAFTKYWWRLVQAVPDHSIDTGVLYWHLFFRRGDSDA